MLNDKLIAFQNNNNKTLLNEKYRPTKFNNLILNNILKEKINNIIKKKQVFNMIITGNSGTGKTSTILCIAKNIYKKNYLDAIYELNASDNRGLDIMNNQINNFCSKKIKLNNNLPKLLILDEADNITIKAQNTLINLMDKYQTTTKFVFTCNKSNKLIEGIQSRCIIIKFNKIKKQYLKDKLKFICNKENINFTLKGIDKIVDICNGDIRKAINYIEVIYYSFNKINIKNIKKIFNQDKENRINDLLMKCLNTESLNEIINDYLIIKNYGYYNNYIILQFINYIKEINIDENLRLKIIDIFNKVYIIINDGIDTNLQILNCLCNVYKLCKRLNKPTSKNLKISS